MTITQAMLDRGLALGLEPEDGEDAKRFGRRVRKAEKETAKPASAPVIIGGGRGR